jgi:nitrite reductase/ring-hydroxylating ferredoxin subunit
MTCPTGGNSKHLAFSSFPQLMTAGGSAGFQGAGYSDPNCQQPDIIVVAQGGGQFVAYSASCSHACCVVNKVGSNFRCPCHGATFSLTDGSCTNGIAPAGLVPLMACADATGVVVTW